MRMEKTQVKMVFIGLLVLCLTAASAPAFAARSDVEDFVTRFYQQCLNRSPDAAGLDSWVDLLVEERYSGAEVARGFVLSEEFVNRNTTDSEFLDILYRAFFNREPDAGGKNNWLTQLQSQTREQVLNGFINATEFDNLCGTYDISPVTTPVKEYVSRFYQYCLGRTADTGGLNNWANYLIDGTQTGADVARGFVFSQEFQNAGTTDEQYVTVLYNAFFGREPDEGGKANWLAELQNGTKTRAEVLDGFIYALEFNNLCSTYDISPNSESIISALDMPDRITLSKVEDSGSTTRSLARALMTRGYADAGTEYSETEKSIWVEDTDALDMVNDILGVVQDSGYQHFINKGPYKALTKKVDDEVQSQSGSSTTSTTTEELMEVTLDVTRQDNNAPMIVKVWVDEEEGEDNFTFKQRIRGYFIVTEGVSDTYPYGKMEAHFKGNLVMNGTEVEPPAFTLALKIDSNEAGQVVVEFIDTGDMVFEQAGVVDQWENEARIIANETLSEGVAYLYTYENFEDPFGGNEEEYSSLVAYDENYFKEQELDSGGSYLGDPIVLDKNNLLTKIYRYRLFYESSGSKVSRISGFPIMLDSGVNAYIGYYGLWAPEEVEVQNGDSATRFGSNEAYTVVKVAGKLKKHTRAQMQLSDLAGVEMSYVTCNDQGCTDSIITWDSTNEYFKRIGERDQQNGQIDYYPVESQTQVTFNEWDGAWCQALNSSLPLGRLYKDDDGNPKVPANADTLYYHVEQTMVPSSDLTLYYWGPAPGQSPDEFWMNPQTQQEQTFNFSAADLVLKDGGGNPVLYPDSEMGVYISPLTTADNRYTQQDFWKAYDAEVYYTWETGANQWNQFTALKSSQNELVNFDPPLQFSYTHTTANDLNGDDTFNGKKFSIDYDGFELHLPWRFDPEEDEWQPMINLKDGVVLEASDGTRYVVKGTEGCMLMATVADTSVADYLVFQDVDPPTLTYDSTKTALVGDLPTGTEVKVIKGELVEN